MKYILYDIFFLFLIFFDVPESNIILFNYWDELTTFAVLVVGLVRLAYMKRIKNKDLFNWGLLISFITLGLIGNIIHPGYQKHLHVIFRDIVAATKFFIIMFLMKDRQIDEIMQVTIIKRAAKISKIIVSFTLVIAIMGLFIKTPFYTGEIRFINCFQFVFSHPTFFVSSYVVLLAILIADSISKNKKIILLDCFLIFLAQRTKGYFVIAVVIILIFLGEKRSLSLVQKLFGSGTRMRIKINVKAYIILILAIIVAWFVGKDKVMLYASYGMTAARPALYFIGIVIMMRYFPIGSGFGTFASNLSGRYYSEIYQLYGIDQVNGMKKVDYSYIGDVFWPYIYGQIGVFGLIIYIKLLWNVAMNQLRSSIRTSCKLAVALLWTYAIIASSAEAYFTNSSGVQLALILCFFIGHGNQKHCKVQ